MTYHSLQTAILQTDTVPSVYGTQMRGTIL